jgi:hypothetical protein
MAERQHPFIVNDSVESTWIPTGWRKRLLKAVCGETRQ